MLSRHQISLSYDNLQEMLKETQQGSSYIAEGPDIVWELNQPFGKWSNHQMHLRDELHLSLTQWDVQEDFKLMMDNQVQPSVGFSFCVSGSFRSTIQGSKHDLVADSSTTHLGLMQGEVKSVSETQSNQVVSLVQLNLDPNLLKTLVEEQCAQSLHDLWHNYDPDYSGFNWQTGHTTPAMTIALQQILQCPYQGLTKRIYLESKALELVALQLNQLTQDHPQPSVILKRDDIERIHLARDILISSLDNPPSLLSLSKQTGINSLKLKQGFRQVFNTTVFGYLTIYRMDEARRLLQLEEWNIAQVAQTVGYSNPSKFAAAFKKRFGITPKACRSS